ncbi:hypothetical protein OG539_05710 [Actinacidiphila glaucinigra]|uniref:hypothetical protein n=1 Tax=Actinacidiphila glaucinigra TaxID=235986 RepID=UPI003246C466
MTCDVCGREMRPVATGDPRERWFCRWCYAWTMLGTHPGEVSRPRYLPANLRWERADRAGPPPGLAHAYGYFGATLCGMRRDGLAPSPYPWVPEWDDACPGCKAAADVIDDRWPVDARGEKYERPLLPPPPGSDWPPF